MDEIIKIIVAKTGMSESMAKTAAETVFTFVKAKLPASFHGTFDSITSQGGDTSTDSPLGEASEMIGKMFGQKQDSW